MNLLCTLNLQIFHEINVPGIKDQNYLLQNNKTGYVIA